MIYLDHKSDPEKELTDAFNILAQSNWSKPELESYDRIIFLKFLIKFRESYHVYQI